MRVIIERYDTGGVLHVPCRYPDGNFRMADDVHGKHKHHVANAILVGHLARNMPYYALLDDEARDVTATDSRVWFGCSLPAVSAGALITSTRIADPKPSDPLVEDEKALSNA
jgi:hypothetical protein